jgi:hypothetical protein
VEELVEQQVLPCPAAAAAAFPAAVVAVVQVERVPG